jgi:superfamily II DNA/RNA helicase
LFYTVVEDDKRNALKQIVKERGISQAFVFVNSKLGCARLARALERDGLRTAALHGDKSQDERLKALEAFKKGEVDLLICTDVAARGLDIKDVPAVFNIDIPFNAEDYIHRIGRTGRAGAKGKAFTFVTKADEEAIESIEKLIGNKIARLGQIEAPADGDERAPAKRARRAPVSKVKEAQMETPEASVEAPEATPVRAKAAAKPVPEKAAAKPARKKPAPKIETAKPDQSAGAAAPGDDSWNGPMPGFLSVGFGS